MHLFIRLVLKMTDSYVKKLEKDNKELHKENEKLSKELDLIKKQCVNIAVQIVMQVQNHALI